MDSSPHTHPHNQPPQNQPPPHPHAVVLRQRAATLTAIAAALERTQVLDLPERAAEHGWRGRGADLAVTIMLRNLHQLHRCADDLRGAALRCRTHADLLDRTMRVAA